MGKWICGKCQSQSTYYQGGGMACMMCGNRTPSRWGFKSTDGTKDVKPIVAPIEHKSDQNNEEEMTMPSKKGTCAECGKERSLPANDKCWKCNGYNYSDKKKASGGGHKVEKKKRTQKPSSSPAAPPTPTSALHQLNHAQLKSLRERVDKFAKDAIAARPKGPIVLVAEQKISDMYPPGVFPLNFTLPENVHLLEPWEKYCRRSHRRSPEDQAMMAIEQILTNEGLI